MPPRGAREPASADSPRRLDYPAVARSSPARLVVALSVAAVLVIFLVYTSIAGGTPSSSRASCPRHARPVSLVGIVVGPRGDALTGRPALRLARHHGQATVPVVYHGDVPDLFKVGPRHRRRRARSRTASSSRKPDTLVTKCPSKYQRRPRSRRKLMADLGRAALARLPRPRRCTRSLAGAYAACAHAGAGSRSRRRTRWSPRSATARRRRGPPVGARSATTSPSPTSPTTRAAKLPTRLHDLGLLGRPGGLAPALAARPHRLRRRGRPAEPPQRAATSSPGSCRCSAWSRRSSRSLLVFVASPFATQAGAGRRAGLNPSLQNPYMLAHPPLLYLGYVGLTVPFAFAMGALLARPHGRALDRRDPPLDARRVDGLGVGQLLGAHWAYVEVGWGGYYAWDPVENAALMPWLAATAFLHSVMVQEKRGMLKVWNMMLVILAFCAVALRDVPDPLRRRELDPLVHAELDRSWFLGFIASPPPSRSSLVFWRLAAAAGEDEARVARVPRGDVPLQQPAARRALPDDPLGRHLPDRLAGSCRGVATQSSTPLLRLLPAHLRAAAALPDGRSGRSIAWRRASLRSLADDVHLARPSLAVATGVLLVALGAGSSSPGCSPTRSRRSCSASIVLEFARGTRRGARSASRAGCARSARSSRATAAATAATSSTPRSSCSRSGSPGRAPTAVAAERKLSSPGQSSRRRRLHAHLPSGWTVAPNAGHPGVARRVDRLRARPPDRDDAPGQELLLRRAADLERDGDPPRAGSAARTRPDRRPDRRTDGSVYLKVLVKPLVNLIWLAGLRLRPRLRRSRSGPTRASSGGSPARYDEARSRSRRDVTTVALVLAALLAVAAVVFVALPFLREPVADGRPPASSPDARRSGGSRSPRSATARSPRSRSSSSTTAPGRSRTRTTAARSASSAARPPRRYARSRVGEDAHRWHRRRPARPAALPRLSAPASARSAAPGSRRRTKRARPPSAAPAGSTG